MKGAAHARSRDSILPPESPSTRSDISRGNRQEEAAKDDHFYKEGDMANK